MIGGAQSTLGLTALKLPGEQTTFPGRALNASTWVEGAAFGPGRDDAKHIGDSNLVLMRDHGFVPPAHMYLSQGEIMPKTAGTALIGPTLGALANTGPPKDRLRAYPHPPRRLEDASSRALSS
jgi:hypothetical protein